MKNYHGKDLASADWLTTHFRVKSAQRMRQINQLPIASGNRVLDACSGPGLFARYFMPMIGENGYLQCIDHDPLNIDLAERNLYNSGFEN
jgi:ubiquinone/menaquinone biosynthesis C-methylase UbiE